MCNQKFKEFYFLTKFHHSQIVILGFVIAAAIISGSVDAKLFKKKKWFPKIFGKPHFLGIKPALGLGGIGSFGGLAGIGGLEVDKTPAEYVDQPKIVEIVRHIPVIQKIEVIKPIEIIKTISVPGKNLEIFLDYPSKI